MKRMVEKDRLAWEDERRKLCGRLLENCNIQLRLTARNFYTSAKACSSNDIYTEESYNIIDRLLARNDFKNPRQYIQYCSPKIERRNTARNFYTSGIQ